MANLIGVVGSTLESRRQFVASLEQDLKTFPWLERGGTAFGDGEIAWAVPPAAPVAVSTSGEGRTTAVLGSLYRNRTDGVDDAEWIEQQIQGGNPAAVSGQNGYYLAATADPSGEVRVGADLLGLFPVYYYSTPDVLLFSTSPGLFHLFPEVHAEMSIPGLVGILLTMHLTGGQTIWKGVRRLAAGHVLVWRRGEEAREVEVGTLQPSTRCFGESLQEHVLGFQNSLQRSVSRETEGREVSMLLSGGLDSRIVAGYLQRLRGGGVPACTFGDAGDHEMRCAAGVVRALGWRHERIPVELSRFPEYAWKQVELEQLSNGNLDLSFFQSVGALHGVRPFMMTGFWGDVVMGGSHVRWAYDPARSDYTFDAMFAHINRFGFSPAIVSRLIAPDVLGTALEEVIGGLRDCFESSPGLPFQKSLMFDLAHRQRFYVGSYAWRLAFGSWPLLPYVDQEVLRAAVGMPAATLLGRRAQVDLIRREFPGLARLPLDRNSEDTSPLDPGVPWKISSAVERLAGRLGLRSRQERRFYYRVIDFHNAGWSAVRYEAEKFRGRAEAVLNHEVLRELLPSPDVPVRFDDGIIDSCGRKSLLGFLLWAGRYL